MAWHRLYRERKYAVGQQLLMLRSRARLTQAELAVLVGIHQRSIQNWEAGAAYPKKEGLERLVQLFLERHVFEPGLEREEVEHLWEQVRQDAPRPLPLLDHAWLDRLLGERQTVSVRTSGESKASLSNSVVDWGEAIDVPILVGRDPDLTLLRRWALDENCRVIALLGLAGIGKTSLAIAFANRVGAHFDAVVYRSLRNAPPLADVLDNLLRFLSAQQAIPPENISDKISALIQLFRDKRCLLVLDNLESILLEGLQAGEYRSGYADYGLLIQRLGETTHRSCLVVTSREKPAEVGLLEGPTAAVRGMTLIGLDEQACQAILGEKAVYGTLDDCAALTRLYGGNPLAVKLVSEPIREVFGGDVGAFLLQGEPFFNGVGKLLAQEFSRSSPVEQDLLYWLAIERELTPLDTLISDMSASVPRREVLAGLESLRRRLLIEHSPNRPAFTLQPVILEYVTARLVETACQEIQDGKPELLKTHALVQATAKEYVRVSQERLIALPLLNKLARVVGGKVEMESRLVRMLDVWRDRAQTDQGYWPGNTLNLLRLSCGELRNLDFSRLSIRQAYLQGIEAQDADFTGSSLSESVLANAFDYGVCVALNGNGSFLAAGTASGEVQVWQVAGRIPILSIQAHTGGIYGIAISSDGKLLASGSVDTTLKVWDVESGKLQATMKGHTGTIHSVALSADGKRVASGSFDGTVRVWSIPDGQPLAVFREHVGIVWGVALSADGQIAASCGVDGTVKIWSIDQRICRMSLQGHRGGVWSVSLSADGRLAASGGHDGTVRLWQTETGTCLGVLQGHTEMVWGVALSADGKRAASGSNDGTVRVWETDSSICLANLSGHRGGIRGVAMSANGEVTASTSFDGTIRLWESSSGLHLASLQGHTGLIWGVAVDEKGGKVASGGLDARLRLWDAENGRLIATSPVQTAEINGVAISRDGRIAASGRRDGIILVWASEDGQPQEILEGHKGLVWSVALNADGSDLASGGYDGTVRLWDTKRGEPIAVLSGHQGPVHCVAISMDGQWIASGGMDGTVRVWERGSTVSKYILKGHTGPVWGVAVSANGELIASAGEDGTVRLWETHSGSFRETLEGHNGAVFCVALSENGSLIVSSGMDGTLRAWQTKGLTPLFSVRAHTGAIWGMAMSADGSIIASGGRDGSVDLWTTATGSHLHTLRPDRSYERMDITGLTGITEAQRTALIALGAVERQTG
jgi:WD40 repeat protein/transcriptional regulator with XRE-family HTH domain